MQNIERKIKSVNLVAVCGDWFCQKKRKKERKNNKMKFKTWLAGQRL